MSQWKEIEAIKAAKAEQERLRAEEERKRQEAEFAKIEEERYKRLLEVEAEK